MRPSKLSCATLAVYAATATLALAYPTELRWAAHGLPALFLGGSPRLPEFELLLQATKGMDSGADAGWIRARLHQALEIDPHSAAAAALAEQYRREGKPELELEQLTRYLKVDPYSLQPYIRIAEIHRAAGREDEHRRIVELGVAFFSSHLEQQLPRIDRSVERRFNQKAASVYDEYKRSLRILRERQWSG